MKIAWVVAAIAALATVAHAQPSAEDLYAEGKAAYDKADYATAITRWEASYALSDEVGLLFNLAQARRLSGDCAGALATYRRFVAADPDPATDQHKLAEDFVRELEPACGVPPPRDVDPQAKLGGGLNSVGRLNATENQAVNSGGKLRTAGLATGGVGIAALATGLVLGHHGQAIGDEVTAACATSCDWGAQKSKDVAGRRDVTIGYVLDAVGVAAIAGGAVMYYLGARGGVTVSPRPREGGAVVSWSGSW